MSQVTALFRHGEAARAGVDALVQASFPSDSISVLMKERSQVTPIEVEQKTGMPVGIALGGAIGAALGLTAIAAFPGLLAAGPAVTALQGLGAAATGAAGGSFAGAYQGLGWWKIDANIPARAIEEGGVLVGVAAPDARRHEAVLVLQRAGADLVDAT
jgi:hypothetical protein